MHVMESGKIRYFCFEAKKSKTCKAFAFISKPNVHSKLTYNGKSSSVTVFCHAVQANPQILFDDFGNEVPTCKFSDRSFFVAWDFLVHI